MSYAFLCVYMKIPDPLSEFIELDYQGEIWNQPIDYEDVPFRCHIIHEHGDLIPDYLM